MLEIERSIDVWQPNNINSKDLKKMGIKIDREQTMLVNSRFCWNAHDAHELRCQTGGPHPDRVSTQGGSQQDKT